MESHIATQLCCKDGERGSRFPHLFEIPRKIWENDLVPKERGGVADCDGILDTGFKVAACAFGGNELI